MTRELLDEFNENIKNLSTNFEEKAWTDGLKLLRTEFDTNQINDPNHYLKMIRELDEFNRQARVLFLYSVFNILCEEEGKLYHFETPYQASMKYDAVIKKDGMYYIRDEDGHFREIFPSPEFANFIDDLYWRLYEE